MSQEIDSNKQRMSLRIEGMHCASCVATIEKTLLSQDGVSKASVSLLDEKAIIEYSSESLDRSALEKAVNSTGYRVRRATMTLTLVREPSSSEWSQILESLKSTSLSASAHLTPTLGVHLPKKPMEPGKDMAEENP